MDLSRDEVTPSNTLLGLPLTALLGPTAAYNLLLLTSFVLTGYGVYRIVFEGTGNRWAGLLAGIAASLAPYRMAHVAGHLNLMATQWIVLNLLFLGRWFKDPRPGTMVLAGLFFALNGLAAWYYFYIGTITVGLLPAGKVLAIRTLLAAASGLVGPAVFWADFPVAGPALCPAHAEIKRPGPAGTVDFRPGGLRGQSREFPSAQPLASPLGKFNLEGFPFPVGVGGGAKPDPGGVGFAAGRFGNGGLSPESGSPVMAFSGGDQRDFSLGAGAQVEQSPLGISSSGPGGSIGRTDGMSPISWIAG